MLTAPGIHWQLDTQVFVFQSLLKYEGRLAEVWNRFIEFTVAVYLEAVTDQLTYPNCAKFDWNGRPMHTYHVHGPTPPSRLNFSLFWSALAQEVPRRPSIMLTDLVQVHHLNHIPRQ